MPCSVIERDELDEFAITPNQQVGGHGQARDLTKVGVRRRVQAVRE